MSTDQKTEPGSSTYRNTAITVPQDWPALARYLRECGHQLGAETPRQFAGGVGNLNYRIELDGKPAVLRRPPPGPKMAGGNDMARERRVLKRLHEQFPLAPKSYHFCEDETIIGDAFQIIEFKDGRSIPFGKQDPVPSCDQAREIGHCIIDTLASLHTVDCDLIGLGEFGKPEGFAARTLAGWRKRAESVIVEDGGKRSFSTLARWLDARIPDEAQPVLLHNDFKIDNMLFARSDDISAAAVLDWDMATRGPAMFDLGTLLSYWVEPSDPAGCRALQQMPSDVWQGFPNRSDVLARYCQKTRTCSDGVGFYHILAMLKLIVVLFQLHARRQQQKDRAGQGPDYEMIAYAYLDLALSLAFDEYV